MSAQLTLQAPTALPPAEVAPYLERLWGEDLQHSNGAATFSLVVYEPSWLQQQLIRTDRNPGPLTGLLDHDLIEAAKAAVPVLDLPFSTAVMDQRLAWRLGQQPGNAQRRRPARPVRGCGHQRPYAPPADHPGPDPG